MIINYNEVLYESYTTIGQCKILRGILALSCFLPFFPFLLSLFCFPFLFSPCFSVPNCQHNKLLSVKNILQENQEEIKLKNM